MFDGFQEREDGLNPFIRVVSVELFEIRKVSGR